MLELGVLTKNKKRLKGVGRIDRHTKISPWNRR